MFGAALHFLILVVLRLQYSDISNFSSQIIFHFCHSFFHSSLILGLGIQTSIMVALVYCWTKYVGLMNYTKRMAIARSKWLEFFISNFGIWHMQCKFFFKWFIQQKTRELNLVQKKFLFTSIVILLKKCQFHCAMPILTSLLFIMTMYVIWFIILEFNAHFNWLLHDLWRTGA